MFQGKLGVPGLPGYPGRQGPKVKYTENGKLVNDRAADEVYVDLSSFAGL